MTVVTETGRSLRRELLTFIKNTMASEDSITTEKLIRLAHDKFDEDEWMREALVREGLNAILPNLANEVRRSRRQRANHASSSDNPRAVIASVFEQVGGGVSKSVLAMTRQEHIFAAERRETAATGLLRYAKFHRAVAALHSDDTTPTGALPAAEVTKLWRKHVETD